MASRPTHRPTMRPTFEVPVTGDGRQIMEHLNTKLQHPHARFTGQVLKRHAYLQVPRDQRSMLSPYLNLKLRVVDDRVVLAGRFTPHPAVWTGFMAVFGVLAMIGLAGLMYGWAQTMVDEYPWGFWVAPACAAVIGFVYGASVIGQGLTSSEMHDLRSFVERSNEEAAGRIPHGDADPAPAD